MSITKKALAAAANAATESVKGSIIISSLDAINGKGKKKKNSLLSAQESMKNTYELNKAVLGAVYEGKGTILDFNR